MDEFLLIVRIITMMFGLLILMFGFLLLNPKLYRKSLEWSLKLRGIKPQINKKAIFFGKIQGIFLILVGVLFILFSFGMTSFF